MTTRLKLLAACAAFTSFAAQAANQHYSFDADAQGWTAATGGSASWISSGGNSGGFLQVADISNDEDFVAVVPAGALGNWSSYLGGSFSFDARNVNNESVNWPSFGQITLTSGQTSLTLDLIPSGQPLADGLWHHYDVPLTASAWGAQLPLVLSNITGATISGEFHAGPTEVLGFDNIGITAAVPEPTTPALMLGGLALLGIVALKRRR